MRYKLDKSKDLPGWWVFTDLENMVVIRFEEHRFNETQRVSFLEEETVVRTMSPAAIAGILADMGDWIARHHYSLAHPTPVYEVQYSEDDERLFVIRHKEPRFRLEVLDDCTVGELAASMKKGGEFLMKVYDRRG